MIMDRLSQNRGILTLSLDALGHWRRVSADCVLVGAGGAPSPLLKSPQ